MLSNGGWEDRELGFLICYSSFCCFACRLDEWTGSSRLSASCTSHQAPRRKRRWGRGGRESCWRKCTGRKTNEASIDSVYRVSKTPDQGTYPLRFLFSLWHFSPLFHLILYFNQSDMPSFITLLVYRPSSLHRMFNPRPRMCLRWSRRQTPQGLRQESPGPIGSFPVICGRSRRAHPRWWRHDGAINCQYHTIGGNPWGDSRSAQQYLGRRESIQLPKFWRARLRCEPEPEHYPQQSNGQLLQSSSLNEPNHSSGICASLDEYMPAGNPVSSESPPPPNHLLDLTSSNDQTNLVVS